MLTTLKAAVSKYLAAKSPAQGTRHEYQTTLVKWDQWGGGVAIENLERKQIREFLDWVYERAVKQDGNNPGRTANKAREHLRAVASWAWEEDLIESHAGESSTRQSGLFRRWLPSKHAISRALHPGRD
jgi:hypothetical protein